MALEATQLLPLVLLVLLVSASTLPTTSSTRRTIAWASATSPVSDSPPGHWDIIFSMAVTLLLLPVLILLTILLLRKAQEEPGQVNPLLVPSRPPSAQPASGEDKPHHTYDAPARENETVHRKGASPRRRASQLSRGSDQQMGSGEDTEDTHYTSLIHLNHFSPEDSICVYTHPRPKPTPDPFLAVEYSSIAKNRPWHSESAALEKEPRI